MSHQQVLARLIDSGPSIDANDPAHVSVQRSIGGEAASVSFFFRRDRLVHIAAYFSEVPAGGKDRRAVFDRLATLLESVYGKPYTVDREAMVVQWHGKGTIESGSGFLVLNTIAFLWRDRAEAFELVFFEHLQPG